MEHCALSFSKRVANQAFVFPGKLIYGTQFHPELDLSSLLDRLRTYPAYIKSITGLGIRISSIAGVVDRSPPRSCSNASLIRY